MFKKIAHPGPGLLDLQDSGVEFDKGGRDPRRSCLHILFKL